MIDSGALDADSVEALASKLSITPRHLSRLFREHLGATPVAVAQTRRLLFAKKLLNETALSMADVAFAAGFGSVRRFNAVFRRTYGRSPTALRHTTPRARTEVSRDDDQEAKPALVLELPYREPFDWRATLEYLAPRATPGVESVSPNSYRRTISISGTAGLLEVRPHAGRPCLELEVRSADARHLLEIVSRVRRLFDLGADPAEISSVLAHDPLLDSCIRTRPGLRVPGAWDGFELAVRAILGQQVTIRGATTLAGRLVERFGTPLETPLAKDLTSLFPAPEALADADLEEIGLPKTRAAAIRRLAGATREGSIDFQPNGDLAESLRKLTSLPGVGDWTAQYIAMRALGEPDAFPAADLGLLKAAAAEGEKLTPGVLRKRAEAWRPWRAYAAMHLWTDPKALQPQRRTTSR